MAEFDERTWQQNKKNAYEMAVAMFLTNPDSVSTRNALEELKGVIDVMLDVVLDKNKPTMTLEEKREAIEILGDAKKYVEHQKKKRAKAALGGINATNGKT